MRHKLAMLARGEIDPDQLQRLTALQEHAVERAAKAPKLSAMQASDREDELGEWLEEHDVPGGWDLAPVYVTAGLGVDWAEEVVASVGGRHLGDAFR